MGWAAAACEADEDAFAPVPDAAEHPVAAIARAANPSIKSREPLFITGPCELRATDAHARRREIRTAAPLLKARVHDPIARGNEP